MSIIEAIILGLIQGLTEFVPVSSSGHLLLIQDVFGSEIGLTFDVALHIGTLLSLLLIFRRDIVELTKALFKRSEKTGLAILLAIATVPAVIAGTLLQEAAETTFRSPIIVAIMLILVGVLMLVAERWTVRHQNKNALEHVSWRQAVIIGTAQAIAIIPGTSRSGSTITAGLFAGLDRVTSTRFSFLLAIPVMLGATLKVMLSEYSMGLVADTPGIFIIGVIVAFLTGLFAIRFLLSFLSRHSLATFAYYRMGLGGIVLLLVLI
ncbi:MAG: undecaprenyl-diphosphatase UppP [Candidatus Saccharibacteria bacterium]|nr:undecaprenyl-diphosphatase UppP [Candidatus Saccharibacteria bacterium]